MTTGQVADRRGALCVTCAGTVKAAVADRARYTADIVSTRHEGDEAGNYGTIVKVRSCGHEQRLLVL